MASDIELISTATDSSDDDDLEIISVRPKTSAGKLFTFMAVLLE